MKYKFSFGQVFPAWVIICGTVFTNTLILGMIIYAFCAGEGFWNVMLIPLWLFANLGSIAGLVRFHMDLGLGRIQADASGIRVVSRKGKTIRELHWDQKILRMRTYTEQGELHLPVGKPELSGIHKVLSRCSLGIIRRQTHFDFSFFL